MGNFTNSVLSTTLIKMSNIFKTRATVNPELNLKPVTADGLLMNQTTNVMPIMNESGVKCMSLKVWFYTADNTTIPTGSAVPLVSECDLSTGDGVGTESQEYELNYYLKQKVRLNDEKCDNASKFSDELAFGLGHKMHLYANSFNQFCITELEANKSIAMGDVPDDVTIDGVTGEYTITGADKWKGAEAADTVAIFDMLAHMKGLPENYLIMAGRALRVPKALAQSHSLNDNERSFVTMFDRNKMYNDVNFLDTIIGAESVFLVDPNVIASYFYSEYPATATPTGDKEGTQIFSVPFTYYDNHQNGGKTLRNVQFVNNGTLQNARIDIRYQKECNAAINNNGKVSHDHTYELDMCSMFALAPVIGDNTGIIRINKAL
jgi:hypothetical protein